ncbi:MAG: hypothetical protein K2H89_06195 [Oscillospiraceae bacterium]|nr:hypothetical protein [Oscillospiraceae bacterium]
MLDFFNTMIQYHLENITYELVASLMTIALGIAFALLKKKMHKTSGFVKYIRQDMALFCLTQIAGSVMLLLFAGGTEFLLVSIFLLLLSLVFLKNIGFSLAHMMIGIVIVLLVMSITRLINLELFMIYALLRICCILVNIAVVSDLVLYFLSKKLNKQTESRHACRQAVLLLFCFLGFIMPSDLNFVNASAYSYGDIFQISPRTQNKPVPEGSVVGHVPGMENTENSNRSDLPAYTSEVLVISKDQILSELSDYVYSYTAEMTENQKNQADCHEFYTQYLNDVSYQNSILNSMMERTKSHKVNPSYLFTQILEYNSQKSRQIPVENSEIRHFDFDINFAAWDADTLESDAYAGGIYNELMKNFSMIPAESTSFPLSQDTNPFYSYFAFCDENAIYYVTLYLTLDAENQITQTDYTLLELVDFNQESEEITLKNYADELEAIYDTAFGAEYSKTAGMYDMILEQGSEQVYVKGYYCNYAK